MIENKFRINTLKASLRGELIQPGDEGYDAANFFRVNQNIKPIL